MLNFGIPELTTMNVYEDELLESNSFLRSFSSGITVSMSIIPMRWSKRLRLNCGGSCITPMPATSGSKLSIDEQLTPSGKSGDFLKLKKTP